MHNICAVPDDLISTPVRPSDLITTQEALDILSYADPSSISRLVKEGTLTPALKNPGKRGAYWFHRSDVQRLADERARAAS